MLVYGQDISILSILQGKCCRDTSASIQASSRLYMPTKLKLFGWTYVRTDGRTDWGWTGRKQCPPDNFDGEGIITVYWTTSLTIYMY